MKKKILFSVIALPLAIHYFNFCITGLAIIIISLFLSLQDEKKNKYWYLKRPIRGILLFRTGETVRIEEVEGVKSYAVPGNLIHKVLINGEIKYRRGILLKYNKTLIDVVRKMSVNEIRELYISLEKNVFIK